MAPQPRKNTNITARKSFYYSCYDLKQPSKVNLSVYFLPADGREKVIKIRCFSNETAIYLNLYYRDCYIIIPTQIFGLIY
ncbi:MAG: hypothetical protein LBR79_01260 [Oscillospiraceae bacterium]|nr:hypothetical protein [Oscillospiraceae bacterium]